jgi:hypothetical protein
MLHIYHFFLKKSHTCKTIILSFSHAFIYLVCSIPQKIIPRKTRLLHVQVFYVINRVPKSQNPILEPKLKISALYLVYRSKAIQMLVLVRMVFK